MACTGSKRATNSTIVLMVCFIVVIVLVKLESVKDYNIDCKYSDKIATKQMFLLTSWEQMVAPRTFINYGLV